jgi:hypothetical protein
MFDFINDPKLLLVAIPAILVGLNSFLKKMGLPERWCPLVNLIGGFLAMPLLLEFQCKPFTAVLISIMIGLSAGGFYDLNQKTVKNE